MVIAQIFYSTFWISAISIVWFYTDWFVHYSHLIGVFEQTRNEYLNYITENTDKYFPDFLHTKSMNTENKLLKFILKVVSCPFCLLVWFSISINTRWSGGNKLLMLQIYSKTTQCQLGAWK